MRRVAVLTSGGDAPGMNACIRAVVRAALDRGIEVVGIRRGYEGIFEGAFQSLDRTGIVNIVQRGGTVLGTSRSPRMRSAAGLHEAVAVLSAHRIDAMVVIGGDGTFRGAAALEAAGGPPAIGIPATIDNDVVGTERTLGFDTAVNTAVDAIDRIRDTSSSHESLHLVEVMGRHCGALALACAVAGGAEAVLVPEIARSDDDLAEHIKTTVSAGKRSVIVVVSEGARPAGAAEVGRHIGAKTNLEHRVTVLGHIQRGGSPSAADRILGATLGIESIAALAAGRRGCFVGESAGRIITAPYEAMGDGPKRLEPHLVAAAALLA